MSFPSAPQTTPIPPLPFLPPLSLRTSAPSPSPLSSKSEEQKARVLPPTVTNQSRFSLPKLRFELRDLSHVGAEDFLTAVIASKALTTAVKSVTSLLYGSPELPTTTIPPTRSVTLILRGMDGVAYTVGSDLDSDHKEIHFSLDYIHRAPAPSRRADEIMGVLTHEMVHCYQYNAFGTCPGGLIEGIADWVRLNANLSPPHWKKEATGKWDAGYQHTGYFLDYLEKRFGQGTVMRINEKLRIAKYEEKNFWTEVCGRPVEQLWGDYAKALEKENETASMPASVTESKRTETNSEKEEDRLSESAKRGLGSTEEEEDCVLVEDERASTPISFEDVSRPSSSVDVGK